MKASFSKSKWEFSQVLLLRNLTDFYHFFCEFFTFFSNSWFLMIKRFVKKLEGNQILWKFIHLFQKRHLCLPFYATLSRLSDFYKLWPFIARAKMQFWSFFEFPFFSYLFKRPFIKILDRINQLQKVFIRRMNQFLLWWAWKSSFCSSYR